MMQLDSNTKDRTSYTPDSQDDEEVKLGNQRSRDDYLYTNLAEAVRKQEQRNGMCRKETERDRR